jgi:hypothetical protein
MGTNSLKITHPNTVHIVFKDFFFFFVVKYALLTTLVYSMSVKMTV